MKLNLGTKVGLGDSLWYGLWDNLSGSLCVNLLDSSWNSLWGGLGDSLSNSLCRRIAELLRREG